MARAFAVLSTAFVLVASNAVPLHPVPAFIHRAECCCDPSTPLEKCCCRGTGEASGDGVRVDRSCRLPDASSDASAPLAAPLAVLTPPTTLPPPEAFRLVADGAFVEPLPPLLNAPDHVPLLPA